MRNLLFRAAMRSSLSPVLLSVALLAAAPLPAYAADDPVSEQVQSAVLKQSRGDIHAFYAQRSRPLWITSAGSLEPAARSLLQLVQTADYDGIDPVVLGAGDLAATLQRAETERSPEALALAELALSRTLTEYVKAVLEERAPTEMIYEHDVLRPIEPTAITVLRAAEKASPAAYVGDMQWVHPMYAELRRTLLTQPASGPVRDAAIASLQRLRDIPAPPWQRHIVIDAANARLWMYEGNRPVDSMKIVVGKADTQTPMMSGYIRNAVLNPYWNVPPHLIRKTIAPGVLSQGIKYLKARGYEVLSDWSEYPDVVDPTTIDWRAVQRGDFDIRVRQRPGGANAMGAVKYEFPNAQGIYLHDTPDKKLMLEDARQFSNGCVRLEDAARLGQWLLGGPLPQDVDAPEKRIDLIQPVPIYITYLTVQEQAGQLAAGLDPYSLDEGARPVFAMQ